MSETEEQKDKRSFTTALYAGLAMQALLGKFDITDLMQDDCKALAKDSFAIAEAMTDEFVKRFSDSDPEN